MATISKFLVVFMIATFGAACGGATLESSDADSEGSTYEEHAEASDFLPAPEVPSNGKADAVPSSFDKNFVVSDEFYRDGDMLTGNQVQALLENTPYGGASWLAAERVDGRRVADIVVDVARRHDLNPVMILTRFQVEGSHLSRSQRPGQRSRNQALGCGCFDGQACQSQYAGLANQIECAAGVLDKRYNQSVDGSWRFKKGHSAQTLDPTTVTPRSHATAALYSYTPWVLVNRGGNWLVWNVTKKFIAHMRNNGFDANGGGGVDGSGSTPEAAFVGTVCVQDDDCDFADGENPALCYDFPDARTGQSRGFCTVVCEGFCPDKAGYPTTFCVESDTAGVGICMAKSQSENNFCNSVTGTSEQELERFVGSSNAEPSTAVVCAP